MTRRVKQVEPKTIPASTITKLWWAFAALLALTVIAQLWVHPHPHFQLDGSFWFYPVYGLLSSIVLVLVSKLLGNFLKRDEDYWQPKKPENSEANYD